MNIRWFESLRIQDIPSVGGKNASLGEMIQQLTKEGIQVPGGFAITAEAYWDFLQTNGLKEKIFNLLASGKSSRGKAIRALIMKTPFSGKLNEDIVNAYRELCNRTSKKEIDVAVRSSATAEDLPDASFAGQQESFLNIRGEKALLEACRACFASLFTDRAISYREAKGFDHAKVALSVGVQKMVRSDLAGAGVMFTLDTESGFRNVVVINAGWGLGEAVVLGEINPDEYEVFKPLLDDPAAMPIIEKQCGAKEKKVVYAKKWGRSTTETIATTPKERQGFVLSSQEILKLAKWGVLIEKHYEKPMDIEWAKDGETNELFIVQARPETIHAQKDSSLYTTCRLVEKGKVLIQGLAIGEGIATGKAQVIKNIGDIGQFQEGSILITHMTSPDWVPIMKKAAGIITDRGGRTSHAAIVSRELGLPAIVGTQTATQTIQSGAQITLSCAEGEKGVVYAGILKFEKREVDLKAIPEISTQIMINISSPGEARRWWQLPCKGVGLARMEFIIDNVIQIHPMALIHFEKVQDAAERKKIEQLTAGYPDKSEYFVEHLSRGIARIAAVFYPHPVIVRMSDFKTNEYANLIGGKVFEPKEENPMLGFRGASRYYSPRYKEGFALECQAIRRIREEMGFSNVIVMIPFCRTLEEADKVLAVLAENGLKRGMQGLQVYVMAEIPSNVILAEEFADRFDGFSIGSNDLTQLVLGVDRDSEELSHLFDERNPAVTRSIASLIQKAHQKKVKVGICGQAPSDYPEFTAFLIKEGIDSISLNADSVLGVIQRISELDGSTKTHKGEFHG